MEQFQYQRGFGNEMSSEAIPGALPEGCNSPQRPPLGLYAEQLTGTSFLMPRRENQRSWLYRILPSVAHSPFVRLESNKSFIAPPFEGSPNPNQLRWDPPAIPSRKTDFIDGLFTVCGNGSPAAMVGSAIHTYACNHSMRERCFQSSDGDLMIVPQEGALKIRTEFGWMAIEPGEIAVVQRGIKIQVILAGDKARGYVCENFGAHFVLPNRGPIGANGLANERDFFAPHAAYEEGPVTLELVNKFGGALWTTTLKQSPFDVVAWHGNYVPYKYDLARFNTINTVSYDHPDPSIFTVLSSPSTAPGVSNIDFVIFPSRWMVAEDTFRPPYYHRNVMSEFMGLIKGTYDAKPGGGFSPGGASLHNCMSSHGPDAAAFTAATEARLKPEYYEDTLAFMFESFMVYAPTKAALEAPTLQKDYYKCWQGLKPMFSKNL